MRMSRWWMAALCAAGLLAGRAWPRQSPEPHWLAKNGHDWRRMPPPAQMAYLEGFLAGAAFAQAAGAAADSAGLTAEVERLRRNGALRFPFAPNVYASRINDYYWWENHRPLPTWY